MYHLLKCLSWPCGKLGSRGMARTARFITFCAFDLLRLRRKVCLQNLDIAFGETFPPEELTRIARRSIYHFVLSFLEFLASKSQNISADIQIVGREHVDAALAKGQGMYCLCFHLGNWEAMGSKMSRTFVPSHVIVKKVGSDAVNRYVDELRRHNDFNWIRREKGKKGDGVRQIREVLKKGQIVGFVIDQARPGEPRLPFFGKPAKTNTSFAAIWCRATAPIVPGFIRRTAPGQHILEFLPEVQMQVTAQREQDILENSKQFNQIVEEVVRAHPEHYFWMHDRWKE